MISENKIKFIKEHGTGIIGMIGLVGIYINIELIKGINIGHLCRPVDMNGVVDELQHVLFQFVIIAIEHLSHHRIVEEIIRIGIEAHNVAMVKPGLYKRVGKTLYAAGVKIYFGLCKPLCCNIIA